MIQSRIALQTKCLKQPFKKALHTAAQLECDGVQIDLRTELRPTELSETGVRQLRKMLADLNLRVGSVAFPTRRGYANPADLERRIDAARAAIEAASKMAARVMVFTLGSVPGSDEAAFPQLVDALATLARDGTRWGVELAAQATDADDEALSALLAALPERAIGLDLNPAEQIAQGRTPQKLVEAYGEHIVHVFANDAVLTLGGAGATQVELGRGTADFPELLGSLEEYHYRGWVTIERSGSPQTFEDCTNAVQFLRSL